MNDDAMPSVASDDDLVLSGVKRNYGKVVALKGINLKVRRGELLTILGPSGSGKTTLLKIIAGFESADAGSVQLSGKDITTVTPSKRDIGMVFQQYALFPHMTVAQNVAFPLEMRKVPRVEIAERVRQALGMIALEGYGDRLPRELSGGQQQRVALARAIVFRPRLLLLDEPFGALDKKLREQMQLEVKRLQERLNLTAVFVTHDQEEALILSDRIAVMNSGQVEQLGTPEEIYRSPASHFVAQFIGESNLFTIVGAGDGTAFVDPNVAIHCPCDVKAPAGSHLLIRPERVRPVTSGSKFDNTFVVAVKELIFLGESVKLRCETSDGFELLARWQNHELGGSKPKVGEKLIMGFARSDVQLVGGTE